MRRGRKETWASDVPISQPEAAPSDVQVDFKGFGFSMGGVVFNVTEAEVEEFFTPTFMPEGFQGSEEDENGR